MNFLPPQTSDPPAWGMDSAALGQRLLPVVQKLTTRVAGLQAAVLCSADGFNICSLGVERQLVSKMAALTSSLFTMGNTVAQSLVSAERDLDMLVLAVDATQIVGIKVPHRNAGHLVLLAASNRATLGALLAGVRVVANEVEALFAAPLGSPPPASDDD